MPASESTSGSSFGDSAGPVPSRARPLAVHTWASALAVTVIVLVWALAGAGYFWPMWVILALALPLAVHAWVALMRRRPGLWRRTHMSFALAVHTGTWLCLTLFFIGLWLASGAGAFWPVWPILGLAVLLAAHASVVFFTSEAQRDLNERIDVLTSTRRGAVAAQDAQLRSIERDLHDGAQARLVALGMSLGMAEQKLDAADPGAAREYLAEARAGAEHALRELRDLARGIHPPVLADRGLEAAVRSLADLSPTTVAVSVDLPTRPAPAVESAAYFVAAEGLANAIKHAHASRVDIRIELRERSLVLEVIDDGAGNADPLGSGLDGLRQRVQALDGNLRLASPPGGPTVLSVELPCAS
ncbi:MAG TPA: histidine kinase [Solirubrobacteraceae bacterium]|nr:histidine kinase [Solirubrobacteraceae bacterium]